MEFSSNRHARGSNPLPFYIPFFFFQKRYPFRAEPPRIGHYREYLPPSSHALFTLYSLLLNYRSQSQ